MKITYYANTMLALESKSYKILCDPWVTFDNFSSTNIYNFPKCNLTKKDVKKLEPDFLYITHTHVDHFDPITLSLFNKKTPVLVADYKINFTARNISALGFKDIRIVPKNGLKLKNSDHVWIEPSVETPDVDSIALFNIDNMNIINANDNIFNNKQCEHFRNLNNGIDISLLPSGAHGPWPMFFDELESKKMLWARERKIRLLENFRKYVNATKPNYVIPIAAGLICGGERVKQYKYSGISPRSEAIKYALKYEDFTPILLSEKVSYDFKKYKYYGKYKESTYKSEKKYLNELVNIPDRFSNKGLFFIDETQRIKDLTPLLTLARKTQFKWQKKLKIKSKRTFFIDVGQDYLYRLKMSDQNVIKIKEKDIKDNVFEIFRMPYELIIGIITRHYFWANVSTDHVFFKRKNCGLDNNLILLMNYFNV